MDTDRKKIIVAAAQAAYSAVVEVEESDKQKKIDHRKLPRSKRRKFRHDQALAAIQRDYLGSETTTDQPLFGAEFKLMFRVSRTRFQVLMEDVQASKFPFFQRKKNLHSNDQCSFEAQLLLPIKTLAYGVPSHLFIDYFQMSKQYARECCKQFDVGMTDSLCHLTLHLQLKFITCRRVSWNLPNITNDTELPAFQYNSAMLVGKKGRSRMFTCISPKVLSTTI